MLSTTRSAGHRHCLLVLLLSGICINGAAANPFVQQWPAAPIVERPAPVKPSLFTLVQLLQLENELLRWDLAGIALNAMIGSYDEALQASTDRPPVSRAGRAKLRRWKQATNALIEHLIALRDALESGAAFELRSDRQGQVLVIVDGDVAIISGLSAVHDRQLKQHIVERFCDYNDCWWLGLERNTEIPYFGDDR